MKNTYLTLAIAGAVVPYYFFLQQMSASGPDLIGFLLLGFANPVAAGFTADLLISSLVFWITMFAAGPDAPRPWAFIAMNLFIGLSCALPAWFYWCERQKETAAAGAPA